MKKIVLLPLFLGVYVSLYSQGGKSGIGLINPDAKLHIKSLSNSTEYALKMDNSINSHTLFFIDINAIKELDGKSSALEIQNSNPEILLNEQQATIEDLKKRIIVMKKNKFQVTIL